MDRNLREAERADAGGEATRFAIELLRAGRRDEALDRLALAWNEGDSKAARAFGEVLESSDPAERLRFAHHLDRLACAGLEDARTAWRRWFPEAGRIVGDRMLRVREFLYQHARSSEPILLYGESGVGINLCAEVLHAVRGEGALEREYVGALALPLWEDALARFESAPPGSTILCAYARAGDGPPGWLDRLLQSSAAKGSRVVVGGFEVEGWPTSLVRCQVPPLRDRFEDLPALTEHLLARHGVQERLSGAALAHLRTHTWGGNVRELDHALHRAVTLAGGGSVSAEVLAWDVPQG